MSAKTPKELFDFEAPFMKEFLDLGEKMLKDGTFDEVASKRIGRAGSRAVSIPDRKALSKAERGEVLLEGLPDFDRPVTREECKLGVRPCPYVSCKHHIYIDVNETTGTLKLNFPDLEVWEMKESCSLDVADRGGITLEEVGAILNLTRERIRQVEAKGLKLLQRGELDAFLEE